MDKDLIVIKNLIEILTSIKFNSKMLIRLEKRGRTYFLILGLGNGIEVAVQPNKLILIGDEKKIKNYLILRDIKEQEVLQLKPQLNKFLELLQRSQILDKLSNKTYLIDLQKGCQETKFIAKREYYTLNLRESL